MLGVSSEIGRLRRALVHEPGAEIDRMVPAMMDELLFDDILYGDSARDEHARLRRVLQLCGVEVAEASDLLAQALAQEEARRWVLDVLMEELPQELRQELAALPAPELAETLVAGRARSGAGPLYTITPLPNWCFQRDPQVIVGRSVIFCSMATPARQREALLARAIFRFHPELRELPVLFDPIGWDPDRPLFLAAERPVLEGGDVLVLSEQVLAVGLSERTNHGAVRQLARALAKRETPRWLVALEIPRRRAYMHLDTLLTVVDRHACLVHAPAILPGPEQLPLWEIDLHGRDLAFQVRDALLPLLARRGLELTPIACGGDDAIAQQREQWTDGANALALAPGVITLFDRNRKTAETLAAHGFRLIEAEDLLLGREEVDLDAGERACILLPCHELSRARGGPHCLVHPLLREPL
jgi:arginine deiminase